MGIMHVLVIFMKLCYLELQMWAKGIWPQYMYFPSLATSLLA